jgi:hypothetical protein
MAAVAIGRVLGPPDRSDKASGTSLTFIMLASKDDPVRKILSRLGTLYCEQMPAVEPVLEVTPSDPFHEVSLEPRLLGPATT